MYLADYIHPGRQGYFDRNIKGFIVNWKRRSVIDLVCAGRTVIDPVCDLVITSYSIHYTKLYELIDNLAGTRNEPEVQLCHC